MKEKRADRRVRRRVTLRLEAKIAVHTPQQRHRLRVSSNPVVYYVEGNPSWVMLTICSVGAARRGGIRHGATVTIYDHRPETVARFARLPQVGTGDRRQVVVPDAVVEEALAEVLPRSARTEVVERVNEAGSVLDTHLNLYPSRTASPEATVAIVSLTGKRATSYVTEGAPLWVWESHSASHSKEHWHRITVVAVDAAHCFTVRCGRVTVDAAHGSVEPREGEQLVA